MGAKSNPFGLSVGSTVWLFAGGEGGEVLTVTGETGRSWLVGRHGYEYAKIPKSHAEPVFERSPGFGGLQRYCLTREAADAVMLARARYAMAARIRDCNDTATLRAVAAALGLPTGVDAKGGA